LKKKLPAINYLPAVALAKAGQLLATVTVLSLALATASGQTPTRSATTLEAGLAPIRKLPLDEPLETSKNMPPAPPRKIETSPRKVSQFGVFTSFQVNVDAGGNNILGDAANEPAIAVDPTDPNKMAIGWRQFDTINSDFRQGGWGFTIDGGVHWTFPGVLESGVFRSDPVAHSDEIGTFFYLSLLGDNFCDDVWHSTNGGQTFIEQSPNGAGHGGDKQWFTIDKTGGPGHGSSINFGAVSSLATRENSTDLPTAGSLGWLRLMYQTIPIPGRSTWIRTATFSLAARTLTGSSDASAPVTHRTGIRQLLLTKTLWSTSVASLFREG
jgi:hypothetical protein